MNTITKLLISVLSFIRSFTGGRHLGLHGAGDPKNRSRKRQIKKVPLSKLIPKGMKTF